MSVTTVACWAGIGVCTSVTGGTCALAYPVCGAADVGACATGALSCRRRLILSDDYQLNVVPPAAERPTSEFKPWRLDLQAALCGLDERALIHAAAVLVLAGVLLLLLLRCADRTGGNECDDAIVKMVAVPAHGSKKPDAKPSIGGWPPAVPLLTQELGRSASSADAVPLVYGQALDHLQWARAASLPTVMPTTIIGVAEEPQMVEPGTEARSAASSVPPSPSVSPGSSARVDLVGANHSLPSEGEGVGEVGGCGQLRTVASERTTKALEVCGGSASSSDSEPEWLKEADDLCQVLREQQQQHYSTSLNRRASEF